jgi:hypothetical protein
MPDANFLISPALNISRWLAISASAGTCRNVGMNSLDAFMITSWFFIYK